MRKLFFNVSGGFEPLSFCSKKNNLKKGTSKTNTQEIRYFDIKNIYVL